MVESAVVPRRSLDHAEPEQQALLEFCRAQYVRLLRWLTLYVADADAAEEICQDAIEQLVRHWRRVGTSDHPEAWLFRVATNRAKSRWRRSAVHERAMSRQSVTDVVATPDLDDGIVVRDALAQLPERQRCALTLRYLLDLAPPQVAVYMDCSVDTVKTHLKRGLAHLRELDAFDFDEEDDEHDASS